MPLLSLLDTLAEKPPRDTEEVLRRTCEALTEAGVPLTRGGFALRTLHPLTVGRGFTWRPGLPMVKATLPHGELSSGRFQNSPLPAIFAGKHKMIRRRLVDPDCPDDFTILADLRIEGVTDYVVLPLRYSAGRIHATTWATDHPEGFSEVQVAMLQRLAAHLGPFVEVHEAWYVAGTLLDTYVGPRTGRRVLAGQIRRGDGDTVNAVLWWCDLRGFTALSERLPAGEVLEVLNRYFEITADLVVASGGEVLKFIGDGMLAIFPVGEEQQRMACERALEAAQLAVQRLLEQQVEGHGPLRIGVALHVGEVMWGNVGAKGRLDFTVIGPAVNLVSRLEGLCKPLGEPILLSESFVDACAQAEVRSVGSHELYGISDALEVFAPES